MSGSKVAIGNDRNETLLKVFYWSTEKGVNAVCFSARIAALNVDCLPAPGMPGQAGKLRSVAGFGNLTEAGSMADLLDLTMLICASVGSMAFGVLAGYGILRAGFALLRPQRRPMAVKARPETASVL
ncbi:MAG: hypothetical protein WBM14_06740 [Terracidiphilus sp.]